MNAITKIFDTASGEIVDPIGFMALDAGMKKQVISIWADHNAKVAAEIAVAFAEKTS